MPAVNFSVGVDMSRGLVLASVLAVWELLVLSAVLTVSVVLFAFWCRGCVCLCCVVVHQTHWPVLHVLPVLIPYLFPLYVQYVILLYRLFSVRSTKPRCLVSLSLFPCCSVLQPANSDAST